MNYSMKTRVLQGAAALIAAGSVMTGIVQGTTGHLISLAADTARQLPLRGEAMEPVAVGKLVIPAKLDGWEREMWDVICRRDNERLLAEKYGRQATADPAPEEPEPEPEPEQEMTYLGSWKVTGYDLCARCCGNTRGLTASGEKAEIGITCAGPRSLPFGTRIWIDGIGERVVQDRGGAVNGQHIDVLCSDHSECYALTGSYDVWLIEEGNS